QRHDPRVFAIGNDLYFRETRRDGVSSFIIVPGGAVNEEAFNKAHSISVWNAKDGSKVTSDDEMLRFIQSYIKGEKDMKEAKGKIVEMLATRKLDKKKAKAAAEGVALSDDDLSNMKERFTKEMDERLSHVVIDFKNKQWRFYDRYDPTDVNPD